MRKNSESAVLDLRCTAVGAEADAQAVHLAAIAAGWRADSLSVQGIEDSVELPVELHADICLPPASTDHRTPRHAMEAVLQHLAAETGSNRETPSDVGSRASAESTRATLPETAEQPPPVSPPLPSGPPARASRGGGRPPPRARWPKAPRAPRPVPPVCHAQERALSTASVLGVPLAIADSAGPLPQLQCQTPAFAGPLAVRHLPPRSPLCPPPPLPPPLSERMSAPEWQASGRC